MHRQIINPSSLVAPKGFAHGVRAGDFLFLGGQTAMDQTGAIVPGGIVKQFVQAFSNVLATLEAGGGTASDLVDVTIYLTDVDDYQRHGREIGKEWRRLAGSDYPAMAGIGVTQLWQPEALIEIQGVAFIAPPPGGTSSDSE